MKSEEAICIIVLFAMVIGILYVGAIRNEKIENGEMTLVSESYMDR